MRAPHMSVACFSMSPLSPCYAFLLLMSIYKRTTFIAFIALYEIIRREAGCRGYNTSFCLTEGWTEGKASQFLSPVLLLE